MRTGLCLSIAQYRLHAALDTAIGASALNFLQARRSPYSDFWQYHTYDVECTNDDAIVVQQQTQNGIPCASHICATDF